MKKHSSVPGVISLDDEATLPIGLRDLLDENFDTFKSYELERDRLDTLSKKNAPLTPLSANRHQLKRNELIREIAVALEDACLLGYHCTRLRDVEITAIQASDGLLPLSSPMLEKRIRNAVLAGELPMKIAETLCLQNEIGPGHQGLVWFLFTQSLLRTEGVKCFFRHWGGEALFKSHEGNPETAPLLQSLGVPCIVEVAVPTQSIISDFFGLGERLLRCYLHRRGINTSHSPDMQGCVKETIGPELIRRIIERLDPDFERLTLCDRWQPPII